MRMGREPAKRGMGAPVVTGLRAGHFAKGRHETCPYTGCTRKGKATYVVDEPNTFNADPSKGTIHLRKVPQILML
jgi:hypothetical protein